MKRILISLLLRVIGAVSGFISGAMIGIVVIILAMIFSGSALGLRNIRGPVFAAAIIGAIVGFCIPRLVTARFLDPWVAVIDANL
jgi:uncharacterized membrane protein SpoIIM required for sporulation